MPILYIVFRILPSRETNAFYLRAFRNDPATLGIRKTIQRTLGYGSFRLSGIRDPERRGSAFWRGAFLIILAIRYSTPKYMDLEAGEDWKCRLWHSFADARCAFIDISDPTPFLEEEVVLTMRCLGPKRTLFVGSPSDSEEALRLRVMTMVGPHVAAPESIQVVMWGAGREQSHAFVQRVRKVASDLPEGTAGLCVEAIPLIRESLEKQQSGCEDDSIFWQGMELGMALFLLWPVVWGVVAPLASLSPVLKVAAYVPNAIILFVWTITFVAYMVERGFD